LRQGFDVLGQNCTAYSQYFHEEVTLLLWQGWTFQAHSSHIEGSLKTSILNKPSKFTEYKKDLLKHIISYE